MNCVTRVLAVDPGYERMGLAIIEKSERGKEELVFSTCVTTSKSKEHAERLKEIGEKIKSIISTWKPDALAIETLFLNSNQKTVMSVSEARGVCLYEASLASLKIFQYTPLQIKIAVTGYGRSDKRQVTEMVKKLVAIPAGKRIDDEYDAIAVGLTCFASRKFSFAK